MDNLTTSGQQRRAEASWLRIWLSQHLASAASGIARLWYTPLASLLTMSALALAISLPLGLWLVLDNLEQVSGSVQDAHTIDLFLRPEMTHQRANALAGQLRGWPGIAAVEQQTPEQGLEELRGRHGWHEIAPLFADENPLPYRLRVIPAGEASTLLAPLKALPEVDLLQYDAQWRQRLEDWLHLGRRLLWVLGGILAIGALLIVGNTVRLDMHTRHEEMQVLHLLGASNGFIRRPFLYLGAWYGLCAGALAIGVLTGAGASLQAPLADSYHSRFALHGFSAVDIVRILAASIALGWLGARLVSGYMLRRFQVT